MNPAHKIPVTVIEFREIYLETRAMHPKMPLRLVYLLAEKRVMDAHGRRKFRNWLSARVAMSQHRKHLVNAETKNGG